MKTCKLLLAAIAATLLLGALATSASARSLSSSSQTLRETFSVVEFRGSGGTTTRCPITLESSFHSRTFAKTANSLVGYVTRATLGVCTATVLAATLPWHIQYTAFTGVLPRITGMRTRIVGFSLQTAEPLLSPCLIASTTAEPLIDAYSRETATETLTTSQVAGSIRMRGCLEGSTNISSTLGAVTVAGAATRVTLRLI